MYKPSSVTDSFLLEPEQVWGMLDSFWRTKVVKSDADLIKFQTFATLLLCANTFERSKHFINAQGIATLEPFAQVPWYPVIVYLDQLDELSYQLYNDGSLYAPGVNVYGQTTTSTFKYPVLPKFADIPTFYDSVTDTKNVIDKARFTYSATTQTITFLEDPFTFLTVGTTSNNRQYVILWARNATLDLNVPFDWTGWLAKYKGSSSFPYVRALQDLWELDVRAPSIMSWKAGNSVGSGFPVAEVAGTVTDITSDSYQVIIVVDERAYTAPLYAPAAVSIGDHVTAGQPLTEGVLFYAGLELAAASPTDVPGIAFKVPLSNGTVVSLYAPNDSFLEWTHNPAVPSPWRFPLGGEAADIDAYWVDRNVDLSTFYPALMPGDLVNPMILLVNDLWKNAITVSAVDLTYLTSDAVSFMDRALLALSPATYLIVQQRVGLTIDSINLDTATDVVGYGYHTTATTDVISTAGSDLILSDYAPLVSLT